MSSALECKNIRTGQTLETFIDLETLRVQDSGSRDAASVTFDLEDLALTYDLRPEDEITLSAVGAPADILFGGFVRGLATHVTAASGRVYSVTAYDYSTLLDRVNVISDSRPAGETDKARLTYLMTTYGSGLLSSSNAKLATLNSNMPAQKFKLLSLRQAIEQVLGSARATGTYRINAYKQLETWDTATGLATAPFNVILGTPAAGQIAPEAFEIATDTSTLYNAYWVRGATAAGSGWFTNAASISAWGRREKYIDAPDSDLAWKASNVGLAALVDTKDPKYRGTMTVRAGDWRSDQRFLLTSVQHGLSAAPFDTVRVSRSYVTPTGLQVMDVEFGSPKGSFTAKHGKEARKQDGTGANPPNSTYTPGSGGGTSVSGCGCPPFDPSLVRHFYFGTFTYMSDSGASARGVGYGTTIYTDANLPTITLGTVGDVWTYAIGVILNAGSGGSNRDYHPEMGLGNVGFSNGNPVGASWSSCLHIQTNNPTPPGDESLSGSGTFTVTSGDAGAAYSATSQMAAGDHVPKTTNVTFWMDPPGWDTGAGVPNPGQPVINDTPTPIADFFTTVFTASYAYIAGTLVVFVDGVRVLGVVETNPATGAFTMPFAPNGATYGSAAEILTINYSAA